MSWEQIFTIIGGNAALFLPVFFWLRSESNADRRDLFNMTMADRKELTNIMAEDRKELMNVISENRNELMGILNEIKEENKSFHGRLCAIEERNRGK